MTKIWVVYKEQRACLFLPTNCWNWRFPVVLIKSTATSLLDVSSDYVNILQLQQTKTCPRMICKRIFWKRLARINLLTVSCRDWLSKLKVVLNIFETSWEEVRIFDWHYENWFMNGSLAFDWKMKPSRQLHVRS